MTFTDHKGLWGQSWIALSTCGHYAIALDNSNPRSTKYRAKFIAGMWATAENIGPARTKREDAEAACAEHSLTPDFSARTVAACARGL